MPTLEELLDFAMPEWGKFDPKDKTLPKKTGFALNPQHVHRARAPYGCKLCYQHIDHMRFCGRGIGKRYWRGSFAMIQNAALEMGGRGMEVRYKRLGESVTWLLTLVETPQEPEWFRDRLNNDAMRF